MDRRASMNRLIAVHRATGVAESLTANRTRFASGDTVTGPSGTTYTLVDTLQSYPHGGWGNSNLDVRGRCLVSDSGAVVSLWKGDVLLSNGHASGFHEASKAERLTWAQDAAACRAELAARTQPAAPTAKRRFGHGHPGIA